MGTVIKGLLPTGCLAAEASSDCDGAEVEPVEVQPEAPARDGGAPAAATDDVADVYLPPDSSSAAAMGDPSPASPVGGGGIPEGHIDISGLNKAEVLAALYNAAKPLGLGYLQCDSTPMTAAEAASLFRGELTFVDYFKGRPLKLRLSGDSFAAFAYDRENGQGTAQRAIDALRAGVIDIGNGSMLPREDDRAGKSALVLRVLADEMVRQAQERAARKPWYHYLNPLNWLRWFFGMR